MKSLQESVAEAITLWEGLWSGPRITPDVVKLWVSLLESEKITVEEFQSASIDVCKQSTFWPKPHEVIERALAYREMKRVENLHLNALPYHAEAPSIYALGESKTEILEQMPEGPKALLAGLAGCGDE